MVNPKELRTMNDFNIIPAQIKEVLEEEIPKEGEDL